MPREIGDNAYVRFPPTGGGGGGVGNEVDNVEMINDKIVFDFFMFEVFLFLKSVRILELFSYAMPHSFFAAVV